jgi:hypothetical protein
MRKGYRGPRVRPCAGPACYLWCAAQPTAASVTRHLDLRVLVGAVLSRRDGRCPAVPQPWDSRALAREPGRCDTPFPAEDGSRS